MGSGCAHETLLLLECQQRQHQVFDNAIGNARGLLTRQEEIFTKRSSHHGPPRRRSDEAKAKHEIDDIRRRPPIHPSELRASISSNPLSGNLGWMGRVRSKEAWMKSFRIVVAAERSAIARARGRMQSD